MATPTAGGRTPANEVVRGDPRYAELVKKRFNKRFGGTPDCFSIASSPDDVAVALEQAASKNQRVTVQSGGHCLEGFVSDPEIRIVIDTSLLSSVHYDRQLGALSIGAGATLGEAYRKLFLGWGVVLPAGQSPDIGIGGHVLGGGFGFLHRQHGLAVDHLYGVEVVVLDKMGKAQSVTATRDPDDPNRELWWAHSGCGGGNLGVVTRYLFRSPGTTGDDPTLLLPKAPEQVTVFKATWDWAQIDEAAFSCIVRNYGEWCEQNAQAESPNASLYSVLIAGRPQHGTIVVHGVVTAGSAPETLIGDHLAAIQRGVGAAHRCEISHSSWLDFALNPFPELFATGPNGVSASRASLKVKDALLRKRHTDQQIAVAYDYLSRKYPTVAGGSIGLATYGGRVNAVAPDATAYAQRASVMTTSYGVGWAQSADQEPSLTWVRELYREMFAATGGVPVPSEVSEGALINHPDADLADPAWNESGLPWSTLYYQDNYPRLQRAKQRWDPNNVFHHALSIRAPTT